jgi:NAD(P)-dependent dehydrogenase (short-subunit alcohol dehydrogenase family)
MQGLLREGLLEGRRVALVAPARAELHDALAGTGAETLELEADLADEAATEKAVKALGEVDALVIDGAALFADAERRSQPPIGDSERRSPLRDALDGAWSALRAVANASWIGPQRPGKAVFVAPAPTAGEHAEAARAAFENLARTLSIEWSRYTITTAAITPDTTPGEDVATLVAYLVSPAGDYFSGARLDLV